MSTSFGDSHDPESPDCHRENQWIASGYVDTPKLPSYTNLKDNHTLGKITLL